MCEFLGIDRSSLGQDSERLSKKPLNLVTPGGRRVQIPAKNLDSGACPGPDPGFAGMTKDARQELFGHALSERPGRRLSTGMATRNLGAALTPLFAVSRARLHLCADFAYQEKLVRFIENHDEPRAAITFYPRNIWRQP